MSEYYLMSQLPSLDGVADTANVPITEEQFNDLCSRFLSKKAFDELNRLSLTPPKVYEKSNSVLIEKWNQGERNLRLVLGRLRAGKLKKNFEMITESFSAELVQRARTVVEMEDPLEAEKILNQYRMDFLEEIRPIDGFALDTVFYYSLKLKLMIRMRKFDEARGKAAYRNIYDSVIGGEEREVE